MSKAVHPVPFCYSDLLSLFTPGTVSEFTVLIFPFIARDLLIFVRVLSIPTTPSPRAPNGLPHRTSSCDRLIGVSSTGES
jgi:hypothetical protein